MNTSRYYYRCRALRTPIERSDDREKIVASAREFSAKNPDDVIEVWDREQSSVPVLILCGRAGKEVCVEEE